LPHYYVQHLSFVYQANIHLINKNSILWNPSIDFLQAHLKFQKFPIVGSERLVRITKLGLKFVRNCKETMAARTTLKRNNKKGTLTLPDLKAYYM
jgi:hypothetical protein